MNDDLYLTADESREWVLDLYRTAWAHAAVTFEECDLDTVGRVPWWGDRGEVTLHQILVHMVSETTATRATPTSCGRPSTVRSAGSPDDGNIEAGYDWPAYVARVEAAARAADVTPHPDPRRAGARHRHRTRTCSSIGGAPQEEERAMSQACSRRGPRPAAHVP